MVRKVYIKYKYVTNLYFSFVECQKETYKAETGDGPCLPCPPFSSGPDYGLTECRCNSGYFRAATDPKNMSCTRKLFITLIYFNI